MNRAYIVPALSIILVIVAIACASPDDKPATWHDDTASNEFGPQTGVVWVETWNASTYHRLMCPRLREGTELKPLPRARHGIETDATACTLCRP